MWIKSTFRNSYKGMWSGFQFYFITAIQEQFFFYIPTSLSFFVFVWNLTFNNFPISCVPLLEIKSLNKQRHFHIPKIYLEEKERKSKKKKKYPKKLLLEQNHTIRSSTNDHCLNVLKGIQFVSVFIWLSNMCASETWSQVEHFNTVTIYQLLSTWQKFLQGFARASLSQIFLDANQTLKFSTDLIFSR